MSARLVPLFQERALLVETAEARLLVAGDLHLGLEDELKRKGVHGLDESRALVEHLGALAAREQATGIVLLGDVKHALGAWDKQARALSPLSELDVTVEIVPGNHDGALDDVVPPGLVVHDTRGILVDDVGLLHGHTWPAEDVLSGGRVVLCHNHPHVALRDEMGGVQTEPCWVRAPLTEAVHQRYPEARLPGEAVLVPAFNPLLGGVALNRADQRPLGPLLAQGLVDLDAGRAFTLDGVDLGTLAGLRAQYEEGER